MVLLLEVLHRDLVDLLHKGDYLLLEGENRLEGLRGDDFFLEEGHSNVDQFLLVYETFEGHVVASESHSGDDLVEEEQHGDVGYLGATGVHARWLLLLGGASGQKDLLRVSGSRLGLFEVLGHI